MVRSHGRIRPIDRILAATTVGGMIASGNGFGDDQPVTSIGSSAELKPPPTLTSTQPEQPGEHEKEVNEARERMKIIVL